MSGCCIRMGNRYKIEKNGVIYVVHRVSGEMCKASSACGEIKYAPSKSRQNKKRIYKERTRDLWNTRREIQTRTKLDQPS